MAKEAQQAGCDAALILPPYFIRLNDDEIFEHFRAVDAALSFPIVLYNIPGNAGNAITPELALRLAELDNVVAIKESAGDWNNFYATLLAVGDKLRVFCGPSSVYGVPAVAAGADGFVDLFPNLWLPGAVDLFHAAKLGRFEEANALQETGRRLTDLFTSGGRSLYPSTKAAMAWLGLAAGDPRPPLRPLSGRMLEEFACRPRRTEYWLTHCTGGRNMTKEKSQPELQPRQYRENYGEFIGVGENGNLWVEDCDVADLADEFGPRPFSSSAKASSAIPTGSSGTLSAATTPRNRSILFANKSNNGLAYRHIMNQEGAGGDCFGVNEMYLSPAGRNRCEHSGAERLQQGGRGTGDGGGQRAVHQH